MNKLVFGAAICFALMSCGGKAETPQSNDSGTTTNTPTRDPNEYDPKRGLGKFNDENVKVDASLNKEMATRGESSANTKCFSCHKMTDERLVGPGWKDVTTRRTAPWIMNFITNPDPMIDKDPELQAQLEICLVRMPNQNLSDDEARDIYEFMRKNDGVN
ncbi:MAG: cytochrome c [Candidatus Competibacteraceae bacterium]|nr:cytochrome c [Candidatus Competibacteraceae bacterium]